MKRLFIVIAFLFTVIQIQAQAKNWKFTSNKKIPIQLDHIESWFAFIPMQSYPVNNRIVSVKEFFIMKWETPNMLYKLFLEDLLTSNRNDEFNTCYPDTNIWFSGLEPYKQYYFQYPAYNQYPVMGVSKIQVEKFCSWLNEKIKLVKLKDWKDKKISFRLPTEVEWMVAASGGDTNAIYAWEGPYMRTLKKGFECDFKANFSHVPDSRIIRNEEGKFVAQEGSGFENVTGTLDSDQAYITTSVYTYWPNAYGLFNMTGNVREMVKEDGFTKGGSWIDPGGECTIQFRNTYIKQGFPCEGFRLVAVVE